MRDTLSSNRDPKLRADRQTDEDVLGEIATEPIDCWFAGYRGGQGSPAARGSYASVTLTRRCWFWCDSLPPSGTDLSGNYYFGPISLDRNIHSARSARKDWRLRHLHEHSVQCTCKSLRTLEAGGLCRGRTATTSHRSCHRDVRSWRRVRRCNGELVMVGCGYKSTACSQRLWSSSYQYREWISARSFWSIDIIVWFKIRSLT